MRRFSETDKKVIDKILQQNSYGFTLVDIIQVVIPDKCYVKIFEDKKAFEIANVKQFRLLVDLEKYKNEKDKFLLNLFHFNDIIEYLQKENFIKVIQSIDFNEAEINKSNLTDNLAFIFNDELRFNLFNKFYYRYQNTAELFQLKKDDFISVEEKLSRRNTRIAFWSCVGTLIAALCAVYTFIDKDDAKPSPTNAAQTIKADTTKQLDTLKSRQNKPAYNSGFGKKLADSSQ